MSIQPDTARDRRRWLAFLREDGRKKLTGWLENPDDPEARCCLGHACKVLGATREVVENDDSPDETGREWPRRVQYDGGYAALPRTVAGNLDIDLNGRFVEPVAIDAARVSADYFDLNEAGQALIPSLAEINDSTDLNPWEIAGMIEEQWLFGNVQPVQSPEPDAEIREAVIWDAKNPD